MTLIAGIISRRDRPLPESACASLAQSISRNATDEVIVFSDHSSYFAKVDISAFGAPGFYVDEDGALSLLTGEPLFASDDNSARANRLQDLTALHYQSLENKWAGLRRADGTFTAAQYQPQSKTLTLMADKLGVRPLYYWLDDEFVVFASALRILEECSLVPKKMDLRAVTEIVGLGFALADRTPYDGISLLKPAEVVQITGDKISRHSYWRWDEIEVSAEPEESRLATVYDCFQSAVNRRLGNDKATVAYLSGGLDSRCIVAALRENCVRVRSVNFARSGTQDYSLGNQFAIEIGANHQSLPKEQGDNVPDYSALMAQALAQSNHGRHDAERPQVVWSGEGGSQLLGHLHFNQLTVELMRAGKAEHAVDEYLEREQVHFPAKLFRRHLLANARELIKQGITEELNQWHAPDAGRNFYLFLVLNEQRRKLMVHFENIDRHRLEFQLPFFDSRFLAAVLATPLDRCLRHEFYVKWLSLFPGAVTAVPWQAYPGHEPCPLPIPAELGYQWDDGYQARERATQRHREIKQAAQLLRAADFPDKILSRRNLRLVAWIHARGWRDYRYAIDAAQTYYAYAKKCGGEFAALAHQQPKKNRALKLRRLVPAPVKRAIKARLLQRKLAKAVARVRDLPLGQVPSVEMLLELQAGWSNEGYAARTDYLEEVAKHAATTSSAILECGSGLTTILVGLLAGRRGVKTLSLEHIPQWQARVNAVLKQLQIPNVQVALAPLRAYDSFDWYEVPLAELPSEFGLVVCDGPPGTTAGGRYGLMPTLGARLAPGSIILLDDTERPNEIEVLRRWAAETPISVSKRETPSGSFAVVTCAGSQASQALPGVTPLEPSAAHSSPTVSVVIPAYNVAPFICETLASIFAQTFTDYEVIVVNDGSPNTEEFERAIGPYRERLHYLKQENRGASAARNAGLRVARGKWIAFLDADDLWLPAYLEEQFRFIREHNCDLVCADAEIFGESSEAGQTYMEAVMAAAPASGEVTFLDLVSGDRSLITSGVVARRELILEIGLFDEALRNAQDFDLWLRLAQHGRLAYQRQVLLRYRARRAVCPATLSILIAGNCASSTRLKSRTTDAGRACRRLSRNPKSSSPARIRAREAPLTAG